VQAKFDMARNIGLKFIIMPSYFKVHDGTEPPFSIVMGHVAQIAAIMTANKDVVYTMHAGFIGSYGEWYYTPLTEANKKTLLLALLNALPADIKIAVRTPGYKQSIFNMTAPKVAGENQTLANRVGVHNDCFLASSSDYGTDAGFSMGSTTWRQFVGIEARDLAVPIGGETCAVSTYSTCSNALTQMAGQGWSYLNLDYNLDVLQGWRDNGCYAEINNRLGYRFQLNEIKVPVSVSRSGTLSMSMIVENKGFAPMVNPHTNELVLISSTGVEYYYNLGSDPRQWKPGVTNISSAISLAASGIPAGEYSVAIAVRDNAVGLRNNPAFSVQFANANVWVAAKGYNKIKNGSVDLKITIAP
jgi:hypothetical protein